MSWTMTGTPPATAARARALLANPPWPRIALGATLALSAGLELFRLGREGYGNGYYAATVRSMLTSWHNFFYASFDPGGFVSVDKPPLGFWVQAAFAKVLGFHGWVLLLPQALAAVASVALLYGLVRRPFGQIAGLVAALALAVTPISVVTARNNTIDSLLVLTSLGAAWAASRAVEGRGRPLRWLLLCMALVGAGFNIKMLQAYLPLPAFVLLYLLAAPVGGRWPLARRALHLLPATAVLLVVSLAWAVAVDLTPPDRRPYVGSSADNTVRELILGHNGLARLLPGRHLFGGRGMAVPAGSAGQAPAGQGAPGGGGLMGAGAEAGTPGPLRLFNRQLAAQVSWLLPLALVGLAAGGWQARPRLAARPGRRVRFAVVPATQEVGRRRHSLLLWSGWLAAVGGFFSVANIFHLYYLVMLSPAIAALSGIGAAALWAQFRGVLAHSDLPWWRRLLGGWVLPAAIAAVAASQARVLSWYPDWSRSLLPPIVGLCAASAAGLLLLCALPRRRNRRVGAGLMTLGVVGLLVAPMWWGAYSIWNAPVPLLPSAGPLGQGLIMPPGGSAPGLPAPSPGAPPAGIQPGAQIRLPGFDPLRTDPKLIAYLEANRGGARYLVAVHGAGAASPIILATGKPVMALGGFSGSDPILTAEQLAELVANGTVRFFLLGSGPPGPGGPAGPAGGTAMASAVPADPDELAAWVRQHCATVPSEQWRGEADRGQDEMAVGPGSFGNALYDCGARR